MTKDKNSIKDILLSLESNYSNYINSLNKINIQLDTFSSNSDINNTWNIYYQKLHNFEHVLNDWFVKISELYNDYVDDDDLSLSLRLIPNIIENNPDDNGQVETIINNIYQKYQEGTINKKEWLAFKKKLSKEEKNYLDLLKSQQLVITIPNIKEKLSSILNPSLNIAEEIVEKNTLPKGCILIDNLLEDPFTILTKDKNKFLKWVKQDTSDKFLIKYNRDKKEEKYTSYITKEKEIVDNLEQVLFTAYINRRKYKEYNYYPTAVDYEELWLLAYPNLVYTAYTKEGIEEYKKYLKKIDTYYEEYKATGHLYLNIEKNIYYDEIDGGIHYKDGSIQNIYAKELKWTLKVLLKEENLKNKKAIKDIFMLANGYITYKRHKKYRK